MKKLTFAAIAIAGLVVVFTRGAGAQSTSLQASLELHTAAEVGASVQARQRLGDGNARVRVKATNLDSRRLSINVRVRYVATNPLGLDEVLDSIVVEPATLSGSLEISRNDLQVHDTYLNASNQPLSYRFTLFRIQNGPSRVRVRVYGDYFR